MTTRRLFSIFVFLLLVTLAHASDERSIKNLSKALTGLARTSIRLKPSYRDSAYDCAQAQT